MHVHFGITCMIPDSEGEHIRVAVSPSMSGTTVPPETAHGIRLSQIGSQFALWCQCQAAGPRLRYRGTPIEVRGRWTVPEALVALAQAGHR
jgi:hypothetical protein